MFLWDATSAFRWGKCHQSTCKFVFLYDHCVMDSKQKMFFEVHVDYWDVGKCVISELFGGGGCQVQFV